MTVPKIRLASGAELPRLAFGTGTALFGTNATQQVTIALDSGFRFVDGAEVYANEESAGEGISSFLKKNTLGLQRSDLYVLTKAGANSMKDLQLGVKDSMRKLQVDYLDAYLLHFPPRGVNGLPTNVEAWKQMEKIKSAGLARSIGVSNWLADDIQEILDAGLSAPEINQTEFHPYCYSHPQYTRLLELQEKHNIITMTYAALAPITKAGQEEALNKTLVEIADKNSKRTPASVLLRWAFQRSQGIITTTTKKESRAKEYLDQLNPQNDSDLELSQDELQAIDKAGKEHSLQKYYMAKYFKP